MPTSPLPTRSADDTRPLASYVLRVRGQPASLRYELLDLRSGERHLFRKSASVAAFLQRNGLRPDDAAADDSPA